MKAYALENIIALHYIVSLEVKMNFSFQTNVWDVDFFVSLSLRQRKLK